MKTNIEATASDIYLRAMFGENAKQVAFNYIVQDAADKCAIVGTTVFGERMRFGAKRTHTLVLCDAIIRPHLVITSDHLRGTGIAGILTSRAMADPGEWLEHGEIILQTALRNARAEG